MLSKNMAELDTVSPVVWPKWCYSTTSTATTTGPTATAGATRKFFLPSATATATASAWRIIQLLFIPTCFPYASIRIFLAIEKKERKKEKQVVSPAADVPRSVSSIIPTQKVEERQMRSYELAVAAAALVMSSETPDGHHCCWLTCVCVSVSY